MRNPHRARNVALAFFVSGLVATPAAYLLPALAANDTAQAVLLSYGLMAIIFGGGTALFRHFDARAKESLARGEDVIARWRVDSDTWRAFIAHNTLLSREPDALYNELAIRDEVPACGIEVIASKTAIEIDGSIHALRLGTPEVTHAELNTSRVRPSFIEMQLYYPGGGHGASGVPQAPSRAVLRFPVAPESLSDAQKVVAHYQHETPRKADFFHGRGDGSDPEDLSTCYACGYQTHHLMSHCPQCGASLQSKRWSRRFGWGLLACGVFITVIMGVVLFNLVSAQK